MQKLNCSIVLYQNDIADFGNAIRSVLNSALINKLFLVDNSATDALKISLREFIADDRIEYIFNNKNLGYGKAHNIALKKSVLESTYHLVLNPDVEFGEGVLEYIFEFMEQHKDVGLILPKVFYKNGELQKLCNLLPKPFNLIGRRFFGNMSWAKRINDKYELKGFNYNHCLNVPNLSGCFMFLRCDVLKKTGFFDERYFMYMEDIDLCRRIHAIAQTLFYPEVSIIHGFEKESYNNNAVLKYHIISAILYFNKWGWIFDKEKDKFNRSVLTELHD